MFCSVILQNIPTTIFVKALFGILKLSFKLYIFRNHQDGYPYLNL